MARNNLTTWPSPFKLGFTITKSSLNTFPCKRVIYACFYASILQVQCIIDQNELIASVIIFPYRTRQDLTLASWEDLYQRSSWQLLKVFWYYSCLLFGYLILLTPPISDTPIQRLTSLPFLQEFVVSKFVLDQNIFLVDHLVILVQLLPSFLLLFCWFCWQKIDVAPSRPKHNMKINYFSFHMYFQILSGGCWEGPSML